MQEPMGEPEPMEESKEKNWRTNQKYRKKTTLVPLKIIIAIYIAVFFFNGSKKLFFLAEDMANFEKL